jgi:triacylglycerol lipase
VVLFGLVAFTSPKTGCGTYTKTKYPIVLAHGAAGFDSLLGVLDYWFGIPENLAADGATVYVTEVSQLNSAEVRGEQLIAQLEQIRAITGKPMVNLIGHSQGGLDVRYVAAVRPDLVASVTTIGTPHQGAEIADTLVADFVNGGFTQDVIATLGNAFGTVIGLLSGHSDPQDAIAGIQSLTTAGVAAFNASYPQGLPTTGCGAGPSTANGIRYYSWTGTGVLTNGADPFDGALGVASLFTHETNDGLVGRCSAHLGQVLRDDYFMNHLDEVNQITGLVSLLEANPISVFRAHANRLKTAGL